MAKLNTKHASATHRVLIFGAPKSGKTQLAAQLAEYYNLIWVDMENGHGTLFKLPEPWQERIELIELKDTKQYPIAIETVLKMLKGAVSICEEHGKVGCMICKREQLAAEKREEDEGVDLSSAFFIDVDVTSLGQDSIVVFDSLTQLTSSAVNNICKSQPDDYKMQTDDWGHLSKLIDIFATTIQQARYNIIAISHETEAETEGKKKTLVPVAGSRNSSRNISKAFDHVIYAERKNKKHVFGSSTGYATNILTGSRTDVLMDGIEGASLLQIFKPELFKQAAQAAGAAPKLVTTSSNTKASDLLARMKNKGVK